MCRSVKNVFWTLLCVLLSFLSAFAEDKKIIPRGFECSDERLNELHRACCRLARENLESAKGEMDLRSLPGCGIDAAACAAAFANNLDMRDFYGKLVRQYLAEAESEGWCEKVEPSRDWFVAVPAVLEVLYRYYGARDIVAEAHPAVLRCARFLLSRYPDGVIPVGFAERFVRDKTTTAEINAQLMWLCYLDFVVRSCGWLEHRETETWRTTAAKMRTAFRERHYHKELTIIGAGPAAPSAHAAGLVLGVFEQLERPRAHGRMCLSVRNSPEGITTGEQTTRMMLGEVSRHEKFEVAANAVQRCKDLEEKYLIGSIDDWLFGYVLGIRVAEDAVGGNRVIFRYPQSAGGITWAKGSIETRCGTVYRSWIADAKGNVIESHGCTGDVEMVNELDEPYPEKEEEEFAPYFDVSFGTGLNNRRIEFRLRDPSVVPEIPVREMQGDRMEVVRGDTVFLRFYHEGKDKPVREYEFIPGATVMKILYRYEGTLKNEVRYVFEPDGTMVKEHRGSDGRLLERISLFKRQIGKTRYVRTVKGDVVKEWHDKFLDNIGFRTVFESSGTGTNQEWISYGYYTSGIGLGSVRSKLCSDGSWTMYEYSPITTPGIRNKRQFTYESAVVTPIDRAEAVTNADGCVIGFVGKAKRIEYDYEPVDFKDNGEFRPSVPRRTVVWELSDDGMRKELSREYFAAIPVADNDKYRTLVREKTTRPGAPYGDPANERKSSFFNGRSESDSIPVRECASFNGEDGIWWATTEYDVPVDAPGGIPYETVIRRSIENPRGRVMREEEWILLPEGGRELLTWRNYTRDADGHEISVETSAGETATKKWDDHNLVSSRDEDGLVRNYGYDAIDRLTHADGNVYDHNLAYDLGSYVTNVHGSVYGLRYDYSLAHNDAGHYTDVNGEPGEKYETETDADGVVRTRLNGKLLTSSVTRNGVTTTYLGPKGLESPRWRSWFCDPDGRYSVLTMPRVGGGVVSVTNRYDRKRDDEKWETKTRYDKIRGCWWRTRRTEIVSGTNRTFRSGSRERITGRRVDGAEERVTLDEKGHETRYLVFRDAVSKVSTEIVTRPTASSPSVNVTSNGVTVMSVSPSGVTNRFERGFQGRLVSETDGRGGVTRFEYDRDGRMCAKTDRCGAKRIYREDRRGRLMSMVCPSGLEVSFRHDDFGRIVETVAGNTRVVNTYDDYGDLVKRVTVVDGKTTDVVEFGYDEPTGLLLNRIDNGRRTDWTYDAENKVRTVGDVDVAAYLTARTNGLEIVRDDFGRAVSYSVKGVRKLSQKYDPVTGRLASVAVDGLGEARVSYLAGTDLIETLRYPDGQTATFRYDAEDRPLCVEWKGGDGAEEIFESPPVKEWEPSEIDAGPDFKEPALVDDPRVYVLAGGLDWPIARKGADDKLRWCRLDATLKEVE